MSTAVKEKKPFLPQRKVPAVAVGAGVAVRSPAGRQPGTVALSIGSEPRVHLLPHGVTERKKAREVRRRLLLVAAVVVLIVIAAYAFASLSLTTAQAGLATAQNTTTQLLTEQGKYSVVTKVNSDINAIVQSQKTATAQEILWSKTLAAVEADMPAGASITGANLDVDTALGAQPVPTTGSLLQPSIATANVTMLIPQGDIPGFLNSLPSIKGFVDATPNSVTSSATAGTYVLAITIHLNDEATSKRFVKAASK
jgi:hypothetical protein